jgi:hypothetical protein
MITIDRLTMQLSGLSEEEGRKLARLVAEDLAMVTLPAGCSPDTANVSVNVPQTPGASVNALSQQIVAEMLRQLERTI